MARCGRAFICFLYFWLPTLISSLSPSSSLPLSLSALSPLFGCCKPSAASSSLFGHCEPSSLFGCCELSAALLLLSGVDLPFFPYPLLQLCLKGCFPCPLPPLFSSLDDNIRSSWSPLGLISPSQIEEIWAPISCASWARTSPWTRLGMIAVRCNCITCA